MYGFGAEWKEIWLRLVFFTQGAPWGSGDELVSGSDHLGLDSSFTAY